MTISNVKKLTEEHRQNISNSLKKIKEIRSQKMKEFHTNNPNKIGFSNGHKFFGDTKTQFQKGHIPWSKKNKGTYHLWDKKDNPMKGKVSPNKGKTNIEIYGEKKAKEINKINSDKHLGKSHIVSEEVKIRLKNMRLKQWNDKNSKYNSEERSIKIKKARAKQITPKKDTSIEVKIQNFLKQLGIEYFTHQYMKIEHGYQCDVLIPSMNLVIECDGDYWHKYPVGNDIDHIRTNELIEKGFKVLRLWEFEIRAMNINNFEEKLLCQ